jgi:hypothetical protein
MDGQNWWQVLNSLGFPLVALYGYIKGYVVSPRELGRVEVLYGELKVRYDKLEAEVREERAVMRGELAETRAMLYRILMGEIQPGTPIANASGD